MPYEIEQRGRQLGVVSDRLVDPLKGAIALQQEGPSGSRIHGQEAVRHSRVVADAVGQDQIAAEAHFLGKEGANRLFQLDVMCCAKLGKRSNGLEKFLHRRHVEQDLI